MERLIERYWPMVVTIVTVLLGVGAQWAVYGLQISDLRATQARQAVDIANLQTQVSLQASEYASLKATIDAINDNVTYIRSRIDRL